MQYEPVIGLEIHVELNCAAKMFCDCPNRAGDEPNHNTCPVCLWFPGALPRFNGEALEKAAMTALGLNCTLPEKSAFDQKVYYYPDLPKGFQLSQAHLPLARNGWLEIITDGRPRRLRIHKVHMEEDVARLIHELEGKTPVSLVDFNRAGVPLIEIVTEPDMRSPREAVEFVRALRTHIRYLGTSECSMESGTMRIDANISLRPAGTHELNTKVEVKNMNSLRHLGDAIAYEIERQTVALNEGEAIILHTRQWDPGKKITVSMRGKFEGPCIPDPAVPPIMMTEDRRRELVRRLPEMPMAKADRFKKAYGLTHEEALAIAADRELAEYFEATVKLKTPPKAAIQWINTQLVPALKERKLELAQSPVTPPRLAALLVLLESGEINAPAAREVLSRLFTSGQTPAEIVEKSGYRQVSDAGELAGMIEEVLAANPSAGSDYRNGAAQALGFLIGQVMQLSQGKANPKLVRELLMGRLQC